MKGGLAIVGITLLLVACSPSDSCRPHKDEASCSADKACKWKAEKKKCKTTKKGEKSPQGKRQLHQLPQSSPRPQWSLRNAPRPAAITRCRRRRPSRSQAIQGESVDLGDGYDPSLSQNAEWRRQPPSENPHLRGR